MAETRKKTYIFSTIIVAGHNSINTNKFKYDEAKNLEPEKKYSLRRVLFKFSCQILQNYLYCVKSLFRRSYISFYENYKI